MRAILAAGLLASAVPFSTAAAEERASPWQGEWTYAAKDQMGVEYGGHLSITDCNETGCAYDLQTGSGRGVCHSDGRFAFRSPSRAVHDREGRDFAGKVGSCSITFEIKGKGTLVTDDNGNGCSSFCGRSASFYGDFHREPSTAAASFDCEKASSPVEKMICSDSTVSNLDKELHRSYRQALAAAINPSLIKEDQRGWLLDHRDRCTIVECLREAYESRIKELRALASRGRVSPSPSRPFEHLKMYQGLHPSSVLDDRIVGPAIKALVGRHFALLSADLAGPSTGAVVRGSGDFEGDACAPHACSVAEAKVYLTQGGSIYIAILDGGDKILYFSNDPPYKKKIFPALKAFIDDRSSPAKISYLSQ